MATVAEPWRPTSELERRLQETVRTGDQEAYFRLLAQSELVIPVPPDRIDGVIADRDRPTWPVQEEDGRTHVLAYTSAAAMRECLGPAYRHFLRLKFTDLAETWPDTRWWLAVDVSAAGTGDAVLPIEARLPSWFIKQVVEGEVGLPKAGRGTVTAPAPAAPAPPVPPAAPVKVPPPAPVEEPEEPAQSPVAEPEPVPEPEPETVVETVPEGGEMAPALNEDTAAPQPDAADVTRLDNPVITDLPDEQDAAQWEELQDQHKELPRKTQRRGEFRPANDVELDLLRAATNNDHDLFLQSLADAEVLLPVPEDMDYLLRPGRPGFPWPSLEVDGKTVIPVFTSPERLADAAESTGIGTDAITLPFTVILRYWPDGSRPMAVNSGSPAGGTILAEQLPGLATWADQRAARRMSEGFEPQNDVERRLFDAALRRDTDAFFKVLLGAQVLVPAEQETPWGIAPDDPSFPWRPVPVHGAVSIQLFTSLKWMNDAIGSSRFVMPSLLEVVSAWPDAEWTLILNPGTPIDATMPGEQVKALSGPPRQETAPPPEPTPEPEAVQVPEEEPATLPAEPPAQTPATSPTAQTPAPPQAPAAPQTPAPPDAAQTATAPHTAQAPAVPPATQGPATPPTAQAPAASPATQAQAAPPAAQTPAAQAPAAVPTEPPAQAPAAQDPTPPHGAQTQATAHPAQAPATPPTTQTPAAPPAAQTPNTPPAAQAPAASPAAQTPGAPPAAQTPTAPAAAQTPTASPASQASAAPHAAQAPVAPSAAQTPTAPPGAQTPVASPTTQTPTPPAAAEAPGTPPAGQSSAASPAAAGPVAADFEPGNRIDQELYEAALAGDSDAFLRILLGANVLVPIPVDAPLEVTPVQREFRWDAAQHGDAAVQVFTSLVRLQEVLPDTRFVYVDFRELIGSWPRTEWDMLLNPGTRIGASLRGDQVRALSEWAIRVGLVQPRPEARTPPPAPEPVQEPEPETIRDVPPARAPLPEPDTERSTQPTIMQKVVAHHHVDWYLRQGYDRVGGFVHPTSDVAELQTPLQLYEALGLLYEESPFQPGDEGVHVIRWPAYCADLYRVPFGGQTEEELAAWGEAGWVIERAPFHGSGFAPGSAGSIREFKVDSVRLPHGAEMYFLAPDGSERFVAMYDPDRLAWLRPENGAAWQRDGAVQ